MSKVKIRDHEFIMPDIFKLVHFTKHETLMFLGSPKDKEEYTIVVGIGRVMAIEKGQEFDLVKMDFGRGYSREILTKNNHARRQIYTLKKGQYAWFYGMMKYYTVEKKQKAFFYAKAFQGWYVPKNMDIMKLDPQEIDKLTEENESKLNFIDELFKESL